MKQYDLIASGYFPKELPPCFTTKLLADAYLSDPKLNNYNTPIRTKPMLFSLAKVQLERKLLKVPNPINQGKLCFTIEKHNTDIQLLYDRSHSSYSIHTPMNHNGRAVDIGNFSFFLKEIFVESFNYKYQLKLDISKYYNTIYTHSIPWVIHTKALAKSSSRPKTLYGDKIDKNIRNGMDGQTVGLPIGPDTSLILSELIGTTIDEYIQNKFPNCKLFRFVDDMYLLCHSYSEAEQALCEFEKIIIEYGLSINHEKTKIQQLPLIKDENRVTALKNHQVSLTSNYLFQESDLLSYFNTIIDLASKNPNKYIISYAIEKIKYIAIHPNNYLTFQKLLLKLLSFEPSIIKDVFQIIYTYSLNPQMYDINTDVIKDFLIPFLRNHILKHNHYEIVWGLWFIKTFNINLDNQLNSDFTNLDDSFSILMVCDLVKNDLCNFDINSFWVNSDFLEPTGSHWLLYYESIMKGYRSGVMCNKYFELLQDNNVIFYDNSKQIEKLGVINNIGDWDNEFDDFLGEDQKMILWNTFISENGGNRKYQG